MADRLVPPGSPHRSQSPRTCRRRRSTAGSCPAANSIARDANFHIRGIGFPYSLFRGRLFTAGWYASAPTGPRQKRRPNLACKFRGSRDAKNEMFKRG